MQILGTPPGEGGGGGGQAYLPEEIRNYNSISNCMGFFGLGPIFWFFGIVSDSFVFVRVGILVGKGGGSGFDPQENKVGIHLSCIFVTHLPKVL